MNKINLESLREAANIYDEQIFAEVTARHLNDLLDAYIAAESKLAELEKQEPIEWQYQARDGSWNNFSSEKHRIDTINSNSWPIRELYLHAKPAEAVQRITEQDARAIFLNLWKAQETDFQFWLETEGRTLLDKLNEHREPEVKAEASVDRG